MVEKVLDYPRVQVAQETGWWCGPATVQNILASRGINRSEASLAQRMGTTTNGTNHIGLLRDVLNAELPAADYRVVQLPNDPPSAAQRENLWQHIVASINAGFGVAINIVAPPSNYPRAVAPSTESPAYGGGTVYHYIAAMGYSDVGGKRVWIADSGFRPFGYWVSLAQLATLIPPKGYTYAAGKTAAPTPPAPATWFDEDVSKTFGFGRSRPLSGLVGIAIHTTESDASTKARDVAAYQARTETGSYNVIVDSTGHRLLCNTDDWQVWATGNKGNDVLLHLAFVARASWTRDQWLAQDKMLRAGATVVRHWCDVRKIPMQRVTAATLPGILGHADTRVWGGTDHTDPGPGFPWDRFIELVKGSTAGGFLMALSDAEQRELLDTTRQNQKDIAKILDQLGPKHETWSEASSFGVDDQGRERTLRDGLIAKLDDIKAGRK